jgi:hypothetical protein
LEHRASVKCFVSLQFLNLRQSVGLLDGGSAHRKATTYAGQHKHRINTDIHALSGIQTYSASALAGEDIWCLRPHGHCDRCGRNCFGETGKTPWSANYWPHRKS